MRRQLHIAARPDGGCHGPRHPQGKHVADLTGLLPPAAIVVLASAEHIVWLAGIDGHGGTHAAHSTALDRFSLLPRKTRR